MNQVKVALIGAGGMANANHYPSIASFDDVSIVGLCDLDEGRLAQTAEKFAVERTFSNYRKMLEETRPDAVYVLMPPHHLFDIAMDVIEGGFALFVEKPPAVTTDQARALGRRAEQKKVVTAVGFQRRYQPVFQTCYQKVKQTGPMQQVVGSFYKNMAPADPSPYYRGAIDILHCDAIHVVDAVRYYCGSSPMQAVASEVRHLDAAYPVSFNALITFENGAVGVVLLNWRTGRRFLKMEYHALGACGFADIEGRGTVWKDNEEKPVLDEPFDKDSKEPHVNQGFYAENRAFIDAVKSGRPPHNSIPDSVFSMELADRIFASAIN
jgi:virulence factor